MKDNNSNVSIRTLKRYTKDIIKETVYTHIPTDREDYSRGERMSVHLSRTARRVKTRIFEYAICNDWTHFVTLTIDKTKHDRYSISGIEKALKKKFKALKRKYSDFTYLIIPEFHKDGAFHFHGLMNWTDISELKPSKRGNVSGRKEFNNLVFNTGFGFSSFIELDSNKLAVSKYITKYITKSNFATFSKNTYMCSRGLKTPELLLKEIAHEPILDPDYKNDYVQVKIHTKTN